MGVTTVDDDVATFKVRFQLGDEVIDGWTGLDEEDDLAGCLELGAELLYGVCALNICAWWLRKIIEDEGQTFTDLLPRSARSCPPCWWFGCMQQR